MKQYRWFWFFLVLLFVAGCKSGGGDDQGLIVYQALDEDGQPQELVVVNPQGEEQHRITMPEMVVQNISVQASHKVLLNTADKVYLLDAEQGDLRELEFGHEVFLGTSQFALSGGGQRWMLLGTPQMDQTFLLDLQSGQTHDLSNLDTGYSYIFYGLFAPDEDYLLLLSQNLWLLPSDEPSRARRLGTGKTGFANSFSSDGKKVAYFQHTETDEFEVVVEDVDGAQPESFAVDAPVTALAFVPRKEQLVLAQGEGVSLLSLDDGQVRELLAFAGRSRRPWFAPSGKKFVLDMETEDGVTLFWYLVDVDGGQTQVLDELQDYMAQWRVPGQRWLFFVDNAPMSPGGSNFIGLDLETGETNQALRLDETMYYLNPVDVSTDGKLGLVMAFNEDRRTQLWLIRADGGAPRLLAEAASAEGSFSPDGKWVAVGISDRVDDRIETQITLMETEGEETRSLGEGFRPVWVRP
jgi:tricorn protease-like protein